MNAPPSFELKFESDRPCLYAQVRADKLNPGEAYRALGDILNEAAERHCRDVIVQCEVPRSERGFLHRAIISLADMRFPGKIAFVECGDETDGPAELGSHVKLFNSIDEAKEWVAEPIGS